MSSSGLNARRAGRPQVARTYEPVLRFEAPYLIEKLVKDRIVDTADEGEALFAEAKKFLILSYVDSDVSWDMYSTRVDEAWHQFVLFTSQYVDFCHRYFGEYLHHNPSNAPEVPGRPELKRSTFKGFSRPLRILLRRAAARRLVGRSIGVVVASRDQRQRGPLAGVGRG